jgi:hypothetical protein
VSCNFNVLFSYYLLSINMYVFNLHNFLVCDRQLLQFSESDIFLEREMVFN